jgi:peptidoglycan/xylan/chitin deacetylase (PgdA/CDA1 family)
LAALKGTMLRAAVATAAGAAGALATATPLLSRPRVQFLCFHAVPRDRLSSFARLIRALHKSHVFEGYRQGVARIRQGRFDAPVMAVSFDDGLHNQLAAARVLEEVAGARACFFVCPSVLDRPERATVERFCATLAIPPTRLLDWDDAAKLIDAGHEIGCHTASHANLAQCTPAQLEDEIAGARQTMISRLGRAAGTHFAWPWGRWQHITPLAAQRVFAAGFSTCASAERGCHIARPRDAASDVCLRRLVLDSWVRVQDALPLLALCSAMSAPSVTTA